jgi:hypothetical protein
MVKGNQNIKHSHIVLKLCGKNQNTDGCLVDNLTIYLYKFMVIYENYLLTFYGVLGDIYLLASPPKCMDCITPLDLIS